MKASLHEILYTLSNAVSNILLTIDAGDLVYEDDAEITLKDDQLIVRKGETIIHQSTI